MSGAENASFWSHFYAKSDHFTKTDRLGTSTGKAEKHGVLPAGWQTIGGTPAVITTWGRLLTSTQSHRRHGKAKTRPYGLIRTDTGIWSATMATGVQTTCHTMQAETAAVTTSVLLALPAPGTLHRCRKLTSVWKPPFFLRRFRSYVNVSYAKTRSGRHERGKLNTMFLSLQAAAPSLASTSHSWARTATQLSTTRFIAGKKTRLFAPFCTLITVNILSLRQARDNHRENSKQRRVFLIANGRMSCLGRTA